MVNPSSKVPQPKSLLELESAKTLHSDFPHLLFIVHDISFSSAI